MRRAFVAVVLAACSYHPDAATGGGTADAADGPGDVAQAIDAPPGAWLDPWTHRKSITIHGGMVAGQLTEFPVLIALDDPDIAQIAKPDGSDLAVTRDDAMTKLAIDVESYASGKLALWVKVPALPAGTDTRLYLYYGNQSATAGDPTQVWTHEYLAAWHLCQDPNNGAAGDIKDVTGHLHDGKAEASMDHADLIAGKLGDAIDFDGSNDFIDVSSKVNVNDEFTVSAWVNLSGGTSIKTVFSNSLSGLDKSGFRLFVNTQTTSDHMILLETSNGTAATHKTATTATGQLTVGQWAHLAVVIDRGAGDATIFVDGVDRTSNPNHNIVTDFQNNASVQLGKMGDAFVWPGGLDQVEISSEKRSSQWIQTAYANQNDPLAFYAVGADELKP